jgi:hypothetical protein
MYRVFTCHARCRGCSARVREKCVAPECADIVKAHHIKRLRRIWSNHWMNCLAEKLQEFPIRTSEKPEPTVVENPIGIAIIVIYAVLPNIVCRIFISRVLRRQGTEIVKLGEKLGLREAP